MPHRNWKIRISDIVKSLSGHQVDTQGTKQVGGKLLFAFHSKLDVGRSMLDVHLLISVSALSSLIPAKRSSFFHRFPVPSVVPLIAYF